MRFIFFLVIILLSCEKSVQPIYHIGSEKIVEVKGVRVEWTDGKNKVSAFPDEVTYLYNTGDAFFSSLTGVITNPSGKMYFVKAERGIYRDKSREGEAEIVEVKTENGYFKGDYLLSIFSSPLTIIVNRCVGNYGRFTISAEECRFFTEEEISIFSGNVRGTVYEVKK